MECIIIIDSIITTTTTKAKFTSLFEHVNHESLSLPSYSINVKEFNLV